METRVKARLIGALILVALIVLLVPEMLSGPRQNQEIRQRWRCRADLHHRSHRADCPGCAECDRQGTASTSCAGRRSPD